MFQEKIQVAQLNTSVPNSSLETFARLTGSSRVTGAGWAPARGGSRICQIDLIDLTGLTHLIYLIDPNYLTRLIEVAVVVGRPAHLQKCIASWALNPLVSGALNDKPDGHTLGCSESKVLAEAPPVQFGLP